MHKFKELGIWKKADYFVLKFTMKQHLFHKKKNLDYPNQLRRVKPNSKSMEGSSRSSNKDFARFLEIAIGLQVFMK